MTEEELDPQPFRCQVNEVRVRFLPCTWREGGGYQCERTSWHITEHEFGDHTIQHARLGNGYSCEAIEDFLTRAN